MSGYVSEFLRRSIASRAQGRCEYCLIREDDTDLGLQVEHIISEKHGGPTTGENLAMACVFCNRFKGTDIGSLSPKSGQLIRFFNPRTDRWLDHFAIDGLEIVPLTEIGSVTIKVLRINHPERLLERKLLQLAGRYP